MVFSSVCQVFSMIASSYEHLKHLNTSHGRVGLVVRTVDGKGRGIGRSISAAFGVHGVYSLVEGRNTLRTSTNGWRAVFMADGDAA